MKRPNPSDIAFTPAVKALQAAAGSRASYARMEKSGGWSTEVTPDLMGFLAGLDMFYLGTTNAAGQPYIQYRGGPKGFLKVLDPRTLAFADFGGNRQFISTGNLSENPRVFIFLMDYANRRRVKVWGSARVVTDDPELLARLSDPSYEAQPERAIVITLEAWDANCPQHIHPRLLESEVVPLIESLQERIRVLEARLGAG
ncbi:MAG: pyridoxamine 5'-phosphate oxidase family protein [Planctomycetes bacterium]|nr:pyridoxamine 5'-phosphate oxidase family protein [Planctomycetota bacterium]